MNHRLSGMSREKGLLFVFLLLVGFCLAGCISYQPASIVITRAGTYLDDGKMYVYLNGKVINKKQPIGKGQTRTIAVANGSHRIWVKVDSLESDKIQFTAENNTVNFSAATERIGGSKTLLLERNID